MPHPSFCKEGVGDARERVPTLCDFLCPLLLLRAGRSCVVRRLEDDVLPTERARFRSWTGSIANPLDPQQELDTELPPTFANHAKAWGPTEWIVPARSKALASLDNPPPGATRTVLQGFASDHNRIVEYINLLSCSRC